MMLQELWVKIIESNTFNFIILVIILAFIFKKINLSEIINGLQSKIQDSVDKSTTAKENSQKELNKAEALMENVDKDTDKIIKDADRNAIAVAKKIVEGSKPQIEIIEKNADKVIENGIMKVKKSLSDIAVKEAVKITADNLKTDLISNPNLHKKYIEEALIELEGINL